MKRAWLFIVVLHGSALKLGISKTFAQPRHRLAAGAITAPLLRSYTIYSAVTKNPLLAGVTLSVDLPLFSVLTMLPDMIAGGQA